MGQSARHRHLGQVHRRCQQWYRPVDASDATGQCRHKIGDEAIFTAQIAFTSSFFVLIFRLDCLWHQSSQVSRRVIDLLPEHLVSHLHDEGTRVLVSGTNEAQHFGPIRIVDIQKLFTSNRHLFSYADPTVPERHRDKRGQWLLP